MFDGIVDRTGPVGDLGRFSVHSSHPFLTEIHKKTANTVLIFRIYGVDQPLDQRILDLHFNILKTLKRGCFFTMQAFYCIGIQIKFENLVINICKRPQIALAFARFSRLVAFCNVHTNALKLCFALFIDGFYDPSENMRAASVTAKQGHISGDGSIRREYTIQIF